MVSDRRKKVWKMMTKFALLPSLPTKWRTIPAAWKRACIPKRPSTNSDLLYFKFCNSFEKNILKKLNLSHIKTITSCQRFSKFQFLFKMCKI